MKKMILVGLGGAVLGVSLLAAAQDANAAEMYRLYNPNSSEHFYTGNRGESDHLRKLGWQYEGIGWIAPDDGLPVHRLYNPNTGDHHYTVNEEEHDFLISKGWRAEGISWHSQNAGLPVYRLYNPNQTGAGTHHYTLSEGERDSLIKLGWSSEGIGWFAESSPQYPYAVALNDFVGTKTFASNGMNVPNEIKWEFNALPSSTEGTLSFIYRGPNGSESQTVYRANVRQIETKNLRVFPMIGSSNQTPRQVSVNTQLQLGEKISGDSRNLSGDLYAYYNNQGGISLITPNYAGNVTEDQRDVMLEYLPN